MSKKFFAILTILVIVLGVSSSLVLAKNNKESRDIPEEDGTYDVPGHPELKVRVFVHKVKPAPQPPLSELKCNLDDPNSLAVVSSTPWKLPANFTSNSRYFLVVSSSCLKTFLAIKRVLALFIKIYTGIKTPDLLRFFSSL